MGFLSFFYSAVPRQPECRQGGENKSVGCDKENPFLEKVLFESGNK